MDVFREAWINQVKVLTEAVDDITTIDDFLAVSGEKIGCLFYLFLCLTPYIVLRRGLMCGMAWLLGHYHLHFCADFNSPDGKLYLSTQFNSQHHFLNISLSNLCLKMMFRLSIGDKIQLPQLLKLTNNRQLQKRWRTRSGLIFALFYHDPFRAGIISVVDNFTV